MKTGIITIHYGINYGSALQSYALSKFLSRLENNNVEVINYIPPRYTKKRRYLQTSKELNGIKKLLYLLAVAPNTFRYQVIFDRFLKQYLPIGKKVYSLPSLREKYSDYDFLITGSDQVWNTDYNEGVDPAYYLAFAGSSTKKISYAASCGKDQFARKELTECKKYWDKFDYLSLREDSTKELFVQMGYVNAIHVLDPIFLLSKEEWMKELPEREIRDGYVFIYALDGDIDNAISIADNIAKEKKLKIAMVSYGHVWSNDARCDYYLKARSPLQFLSLLANSDYVVTNSFHGIAFSLRFRKQFVPVPRDKYNNRIESILRLVELDDRLFRRGKKYLVEPIDYENRVDIIINEMQIRSKDYLLDILTSGDKFETKK